LIELLVVIAIIAVLAALLVPVASKMREKAKLTEKISNLRQIWVAHSMFVGDNDGRMLPVSDKTMPGNNGQNWRVMLARYILAADSVTTSEANMMEVFVDPFFAAHNPEQAHLSGYAMNLRPGLPEDNAQNCHWDPTPRSYEREYKVATLSHATNRIFLADSSNAWFFKEDDAAQKLDMTRHEGKGMALMYDGSTRLMSLDEAVVSVSDPEKLSETK
jgi:general secretion pathway protein G